MKAIDLKKSILQHAIEGKLVSQDENDEPAAKLLDSIKKEKEKLIKSGDLKAGKPLPPITEEEIPFEIPKSWQWVRLGEVGTYKKGPFGSSLTKGMFIKKDKTAIKVYEQKNAIQKNHKLGEYYISNKYFESNMKGFEVFSGEIIVSCAGTIGETYILPTDIEKGIINQALMKMKITSLINIDYFLMYFDYVLKKLAQSGSKGSAIKNIPPFEVFKKLLFPLPPLAEQQRIVDKIEDVMLHIDKYDRLEKELSILEVGFVPNLRKSLLQHAIQGKLVAQDENDEPAAKLLDSIKKEKEKLIKSGDLKAGKPLPPITEEEIPFEIPKSWQWVRLGEVGETNIGLTYKPTDISKKGITVLRSNNIQNNKICFDEIIRVSSNVPKNLLTKKNDIIICVRNGSKNLVGKSILLQEGGYTYGAFMASYRSICNEYIHVFISSPLFRNQLSDSKTTTINQLTQDMLKKILFPLPPLAEQQRIVEKLDELLSLCDTLEKE